MVKTAKKTAVRNKPRSRRKSNTNKQTLAQLLAMPTSRSSRTPPAPQMVKAHTRNGNRPTHGGRPAPQQFQTDSYKLPSEMPHGIPNEPHPLMAMLAGIPGVRVIRMGSPPPQPQRDEPNDLLDFLKFLEQDAAENCPCPNCAARREASRPQPMNPLNALIMKVAKLADDQHGMGGQLVAETARAIGV